MATKHRKLLLVIVVLFASLLHVESGHGGVEYSSSNSDANEKHEAAAHLPTPTERPSLNELSDSNPVAYTDGKSGENLDELLKVQQTQSLTRQSTTPPLATSGT